VNRARGPAARTVLAAACGVAAALPAPALDPKAGGAAGSGATGVRFTEISREAGLDFVHRHGGTGAKYMIETMGSGGGVLDYDGDGREDLYLVQAGPLPGSRGAGGSRNALFRNEGNGRFRDVTLEAGASGRGYGMGFCSGDVDNDGDPDVYLTVFGENVFLLNRGDGTFAEATREAGLGDRLWGSSCALADVNGDGALDLYIANYVDYTFAKNKPCGDIPRGILSYCHPDAYDGVSGVLYRNNLDGTFTDVTREAGLHHPEGKGLGVVFGDYDGDGDQDIYVANDSVANFLFVNDGRGRFTEEALFAGVAYNENGETQAGMGVDMGDLDNDGDPDLFVTNLDMETNSLYRNRGDGSFTDDTYPSGLGVPSLLFVGFGTNFLDFDHDGDLDIFVANGHILDDAQVYNQSVTYRQRAHLYVNDGTGRFEEQGLAHGAFFAMEGVARGSAAFDLEGDGDLDLLVTYCNEPARLLRNDGGSRGRWLRVRAVGRVSNRDGIGARITVDAGERRQVREVRAGSSYLSRSSLAVHVGLGRASRVETMEVLWPSGRIQRFTDLAPDRLLVVDEERGILGW
jgi:hypothetical protein